MDIFVNDWAEVLEPITETDYFKNLMHNLKLEYESHVCFPPSHEVFRAFYYCAFKDTKLVFLGQDPYPTRGAANGLSFSVNEGVRVPPSLANIFKEISDEFGEKPTTTDFRKIAKSGVLFLNTHLSVREGEPMSHAYLNWEFFTDFVIQKLGEREDVVFLLLGREAGNKAKFIKHKENIVTAPHPSPLSAYRGFFGSGVFRQVNERLAVLNKEPINWLL